MDFNLEQFWMGLGQVLSGLLIGLLAFVAAKVKKYLSKRKENSVEVMVNKNNRIKDILTEIRVSLDADRVKLFQVHNGDYFVNGSSIQKISLTHFVLGTGIGSPYGVDTIHRNIPISYVVHCIELCLKQKAYVTSVSDIADDVYFKSLLRHNGTETALFAGIFDRKQGLLGVLVITWLERIPVDPEQVEKAKGFAQKISDELMLGHLSK